jgi:O-succinylbenzoic acid--CoA ligase
LEKTFVSWTLHSDVCREFPDFKSSSSEAYLNPKFSDSLKSELTQNLFQSPFVAGQIVITTSGTTGSPKLLMISKNSFLRAAERVNLALKATSDDRWHCALPLFHVGGLSIGARAKMLGQAEPIVLPFGGWSPERFVEEVNRFSCTLSALVPTQVVDLLRSGVAAPSSLRAILVGGAALSRDLFLQAQALGWKLVPSFGMSETCAAIAFAKMADAGDFEYSDSHSSFQYEALAEVEIQEHFFGGQTLLAVRCPSLASGLLNFSTHQWDALCLEDGFFRRSDQIKLVMPNQFFHLGRADELLKVRGEFVNVSELKKEVIQVFGCHPEQVRLELDADQRLHLKLDSSQKNAKALNEVSRAQMARLGISDIILDSETVSWKK